MTTSKTSHTEYDAATRNQLIGAMHATGELTKSANLVGMEKSAVSCLWKKAQKQGQLKIYFALAIHLSLVTEQSKPSYVTA